MSHPNERIALIRNLILHDPSDDNGLVLKACERMKPDFKSPSVEEIEKLRARVFEKYGFKSGKDVPTSGSPPVLDPLALAVILWRSRPRWFPSQINAVLRTDGITLTESQLTETKIAAAKLSPLARVATKPSPSDPHKALRRLILLHPAAPIAEIQKLWLKEGLSQDDMPDYKRYANALGSLRAKYGVDDIRLVMYRSADSTLASVSNACRKLWAKHPHYKMHQIRDLLDNDGLALSPKQIRNMRMEVVEDKPVEPSKNKPTSKKLSKKKTKVGSALRQLVKNLPHPSEFEPNEPSPDPNQDAGPRARFERRGRQPNAQRALVPEQPVQPPVNAYTALEEELDALVLRAMQLENSKLVASLRAARREATIKSAVSEG